VAAVWLSARVAAEGDQRVSPWMAASSPW